jgi:hypothetical protein
MGNCGGATATALRGGVARPWLRCCSWPRRPRGECGREGVLSSGKMRWARESNGFLGGEAEREDDSKLERGGACLVGIGETVTEDAAWKASLRC